MINKNDFAIEATIGGSTINVIFIDSYEGVNPMTNEVEMTNPQALCIESDVSGIVSHGTTVTIDSIDYKVRGIQNDGEGLTVLILSKD